MQEKHYIRKKALRAALFVLLLGVVGMTNVHAYDFTAVAPNGQTLYYTITNSNLSYAKVVYPGTSNSNPWGDFTKPSGNLIIPGSVYNSNNSKYYTVVSIGNYAFYGCSDITELTIGEEMTSVGDFSFWNCPSLTTVHFNAVNCTEMYTSSNGSYSVFNSGTTNTGSTPITTLTIGSGVNRIPNYAFRNSPGLDQQLVLPSGLTYIGKEAFYHCSSLHGNLAIPNSVTSIGEGAFNGCSGITGTLPLPNQLTTIGKSAFRECSGLTGHLLLPNSVTSLGDYSFYGCTGITELTVGTGVASVGDFSFWNCPSLTTVHFNAENCTEMYTSSNGSYSVFNSGTTNTGSTAITTLTIGSGVNRIPNYAFRNSPGLDQQLTLPSGLTYIGKEAFYHCSSLYGNLAIPNSVTSIGEGAFNGCSGITGTLPLPNQLTTIGKSAFRECSGLTGHLLLPNSVTSLGDYSFYGCTGITELTVGTGVTSVGDFSFWNCPSLTTVHFNAVNCTEMYTSSNGSYSVFNSGTTNTGSTAITTLTIGSGVNRIPNYAFRNSPSLDQQLVLPSGLTYIGKEAFYHCSSLHGNLAIPNSVTSIGEGAFNGCSGITGTLPLPNQLTTIGKSAFRECSGLTGHLLLPNSVTSLGDYSFYGCTGIAELTVGTGVTSVGDFSFWNCPSLTTVHFNAENCTEMYTSSNGSYSVFNSGTTNTGYTAITTLTIGSGVNRIPNYAFRNSPGLNQQLSLPSGLTYIGKEAFYHCNSLYGNLAIPNSVTSIGEGAFNGCSGITGTLPLPNQLTTIGKSAFRECSGLTGHLLLPNSVTSLGDYSFYGCTGIAELTVGTGVTSVGDFSFWNCPSLTTVHFNAVNCTEMYTSSSGSYSVFNSGTTNTGYTPITTLTIGSGVNRIPNHAFRKSPGISGVTLPQWLTNIGNYAFSDCENLAYITSLSTTPPTVGNNAFNNVSLSIPVYVPCGCVEAYQSAAYWNEFTNIQEVCSQIQTVQLDQGWNWFSTNVEVILDDLKAALLEALPNASITIKSRTQSTKYIVRTHTWNGTLDWDVTQMYKIEVPSDCEITLEGALVNPVDHPITIVSGPNWIGYPLAEGMAVAEALANFEAVTGDVIKAKSGSSRYRNGSWRPNGLNTLEPGQGYIFNSAATGNRRLVFPMGAK